MGKGRLVRGVVPAGQIPMSIGIHALEPVMHSPGRGPHLDSVEFCPSPGDSSPALASVRGWAGGREKTAPNGIVRELFPD